MKRRHFSLTAAALLAAGALPLAGCDRQRPAGAGAVSASASGASAGGARRHVSLGMTLEPPGLDPTAGAASAIAEVTLYNVFETLTKIGPDGQVSPLLAERWEVAPDLKTYTFHLRRGVSFHNGEPFNAEAVRFSFERAAADGSTNKDKRTFAAMQVRVLDTHTVEIRNREPDPDFLFLLGLATAIVVEPKSAASNATQPVGTGPYHLDRWAKGASISLKAWPGWRDAATLPIASASFRFISDPAAQVAALLAGDVDAFPRVTTRGVERLRNTSDWQFIVAGSRAKTVLAINNARKPLDDVRVRRAILAAIDRQAVIAAAADGYGVPIGSYYVPGAPGYVDTTAVNPYDPARARALLAEAGVTTPLSLRLTLPPPAYARQGGEVVVAQLAQVGIQCKVQNVEWAQWLSGTYGSKDYDLSIVSHVEPVDLGNFAKPDYYFGYHSARFNALYDRIKTTPQPEPRQALLAEAQRLLAEDAAAGFLFQPQWLTLAKPGLRGLWHDMPVFVNDLSALSWD